MINKKPMQHDSDQLRRAAEAKFVREQLPSVTNRTADELLHELQVHQIELEMQNENLREAHVEMEKSRDRYVYLYDLAPVGYLTLSSEGLIEEANLTAANLLGTERKILINNNFNKYIIPSEQDRWHFFLRDLQHNKNLNIDLTLKHGDGTDFYAQLNCLGTKTNDLTTSLLVTLTDITARRRMEAVQLKQQELEDKESERRKLEYAYGEWINALDAVNDPIFLHDKEFRILRCNRAYQKLAGIPFKQIIGRLYYEIFPITHAPMSRCMQAIEKEEEEEVQIGDAVFRSRAYAIRDKLNVYLYSVHVLEDIAERKQMEDLLRESDNNYRYLFENSPVGKSVTFITGEIHVNQAFCKMVGYSLEELQGLKWQDISYPDDIEATQRIVDSLISGQTDSARFDKRYLHKNGSVVWADVSTTLRRDQNGKPLYLMTVAIDISARKRLEITLDHSNRVLAARSRVNAALAHAVDEETLMQIVCQAIVNERGFRMAWVGYVLQDENKTIKVMASAGVDDGYLDAAQLIWQETERGMGPSGQAVRVGHAQLCQDIAHDPSYLPWRDAALKHGYAASISLPLHDSENTVFGILDVYADQINAFIPAEVEILKEMSEDLSFGVRVLRTYLERDAAAEKVRQQVLQLQDNLDDTIRAIATIVEIRDPYTAGHQRRVANLACAIARQMGLPDERMHGIQIAGSVHDLGKIQIPAEILSRPGKISDLEFSLIKQHPQAGFDILKGVEFPWPVAQIVLQHHERLDGSGYPQGLKGNDILLEARILSVADIVEAMSSHRPYRPGLGIASALDEITRGRGVYYDPQVVDSCLVVFREQKYVFPL